MPELKTIRAAVRAACRQVPERAQDKRLARALELLGVYPARARNFSLANFDAKSLQGAIVRFFNAG